MSIESDKLFFRNFTLVVVLLAVMMVAFGIIAAWAGSRADLGRPTDLGVVERTAPIGQVRTELGALPATQMESAPQVEPATTPPAAPVMVAGTNGEPSTSKAESMAAIDGEGIYNGLCLSCHGTGIPGIPQLGDKATWEPRIAKGMDGLYANAINGYVGESGMPMPARGGNPALSDDEVKAAVDFMVNAVQAPQ